jgi:hypothetical protein
MTQAYRCDETAIENQNDSKLSLESKRISFTKKFRRATHAIRFGLSMAQRKISRKDQPYGAACADANIDHANRTTRNASCVDSVFRTRKRFPLCESVYGDACFDCMT